MIPFQCTKNEVFHQGFFLIEEIADLVLFTEKILDGKLHFLYSVRSFPLKLRKICASQKIFTKM